MGLIDLLPNSNLGLQGATPVTIASANPNSTLHNQSSINNTPAIDQSPSSLDLDGQVPVVSPTGQGLPYMNNLPG
jgi:hypothetical protein